MRYLIFWTILAIILTIGVAGCELMDRISQGVVDANTTGQDFLRSPTGQAIPLDARLLIEGGLVLASSLALSYQKWRADQMKNTAKSIVKGIDAAEKAAANPDKPKAIKGYIKEAMQLTGQYDRCNKIVDQLKVS